MNSVRRIYESFLIECFKHLIKDRLLIYSFYPTSIPNYMSKQNFKLVEDVNDIVNNK